MNTPRANTRTWAQATRPYLWLTAGKNSELTICLTCLYKCGTETEGHINPKLTGESFWMRSWATCTKFLSSCMCFWKRRLSSSSSRSKSLAASSKAWMRPFQERSAGTWGATAELTPVPITSTSSGARLVFRLGSSFLWGRQKWSDAGSNKSFCVWYFLSTRDHRRD